MSNILCTGGAGFICSHLVDALVAKNHKVIILDNLSTGNYRNINDKAIFHHLDICDPKVESIFSENQIDYVFHLAAQVNLRKSLEHPAFDAQTNIVGSLNLIQNAVKYKVKKLIFSSTGGAIYASGQKLPWREVDLEIPKSPYGLAKLTVEKYLYLMQQLHNFESVNLRFSNVIGPRQAGGESGILSILSSKALKNEDINIFSTGEQSRDFVAVEDVVSACMLSMNKTLKAKAYNVSTNTQTTVSQLLEMVIKLTNSKSKINYLPAIPGEVEHTRLSYDWLAKEGWKPTITLEQSVKNTIDWFRINE